MDTGNGESADAVVDAQGLSTRGVPARDDWRNLVAHVEGPFVTPRSVVVVGNDVEVEDPDALRVEGGGVTRLVTSGERTAGVIVDLGRMAMGMVEIGVRRAGGVSLRAAYAQFRQFLGPEGDGMDAPFGTDAHPFSRFDVFDPEVFEEGEPALLVSPAKREARYLMVTLDGAGEAEIDFVRVRQTIYPVTYDGYFLSSDDLLNRAWYASAYTGDLATVSEDSELPGAPDGPSPWMLTVTFDRVLFMGDLHMQALAGYYQSSDYRWLVRNTLQQFGCIQNPDGSLPSCSSHLVTPVPDDPGPPDGWRRPEEGPDPDLAVGHAGGWSLVHDLTIDSFTAFWVAGLADYYLYCGDAAFVEPLLPVARRAVGFLTGRTTADGLFYEPEDQRTNPDAERPWVANWQPPDIATGVDAFTNAVFYDALKSLARLEEDVARSPEAARQLEEQAEAVRRALVEQLWDPDAGAMVLNTEDPRRDHTGDANAGNLMFRTLDHERARSAMDFLAEKLATPFGTRASEYEDNPYRNAAAGGGIWQLLHSIEALGRVRYGDGRGAVDLIRRSWGHMLDQGPGTGWFACEPDGLPGTPFANNSWVTAIPALSEGILGIRPLAAGFQRWEIAPQPSGLEWAQGRVPTPGGSIASRWEHHDSSFVLTVETPEHDGREGRVAVPLLGRSRDVAVDGELVWQNDRPLGATSAERRGDTVVFSHVRGNHTFAWTGPRS
jgi:alpha-L-rhamnosidase